MIRVRKSTKGFTLIELLTVIAIIGILASLTLMAVNRARLRARIAKAQGEVRELTRAWGAYWMAFNEWPESLRDATNANMTAGNMRYLLGSNPMRLKLIDAGSKVSTEGFKDPWGNYYQVDFSQTQTPGQDVFEACVSFPLQRRYQYENM